MPGTRRRFLKQSSLIAAATTLPPYLLEREAEAAAAVDRGAIADAALTAAKAAGASYADVRVNRYRFEAVITREQQVQAVQRNQSFGLGVRALVNGSWGFAASRQVTAAEAKRMAGLAVEIAKANGAHQRKRIELVAAPKVVTKWTNAYKRDPFEVSLGTKAQFLLKLNETAMKVKGVSFVNSAVFFVNEQKYFGSSDGSRIEQDIVRSYPNFNVTAVDPTRGDFQQRRSLSGPQGMGFEFLDNYPWLQEAEEASFEVVEKLKAKAVVPGKYDLVLHPTHLWLTIHESVGHSTELDRALGWEANYAGTSFLTPDKLGTFQFGSKLVNIVADRTQPAGLATVGYDDDGVVAQRWHLIKDGVFVDWQTTRDLAAVAGRKSSNGCAHADSWGSVTFPRMPNVSLEPRGQGGVDELIADVKDGILILGDGSFSIDMQRYNFQFGGQVFYEIKNGKRGGLLRDVAYQSRTPDFWGACDGLGGDASYLLNGSFNDGKGEPGQANAVSHGCPPARFRQINVLNTAADRGRS
jgi:TldD protein